MSPISRSNTLSTSSSVLLNRLLTHGRFRHIQALLKLVELGSVQKAANAMGVTQSSVTQALAYLEKLLEVQLFERHARGVRPTEACRELLPAAKQLMSGLIDASESLSARSRAGQGAVRVMASAAAIQGILLNALPAFAARHPEILIVLTEAEGEDQMRAIARGEVELAVCRSRAVLPQGWTFHRLIDDRMTVVCPRGHSLTKRRKVDWRALASQHWLLMPAGTAARAVFDDMAQNFPSAPATYPLVTRALGVIVPIMCDQSLCALLPRSVVHLQLQGGTLQEISMQAPIRLAPVGVLRPQEMTKAASLLDGFLIEWARTYGTEGMGE